MHRRMKQNKIYKCELVIAGPGAGKTFNMVNNVIKVIGELKPHKFIAVVTYTNAATIKIKYELGKRIKIPNNVFIGTIHSFLNRFILKPYGVLFNLVPSQYSLMEGFEEDSSNKNAGEKIILENAKLAKMAKAGFVTYNYLETLCIKIINCKHIIELKKKDGLSTYEKNRIDEENKKIKKKRNNLKREIQRIISERLQFVFIDEYQDCNNSQHTIFDILRKESTYVYCIGDPEQYIYGFTAKDKHKKRPDRNNIPIRNFESNRKIKCTYGVTKDEIESKEINRRSTSKIIKLLNQLRDIKQHQAEIIKFPHNEANILFIDKNSINDIVQCFLDYCHKYYSEVDLKNTNILKYFLAFTDGIYDNVKSEYGMTVFDCNKIENSAKLKSAVDYIVNISCLKHKELINKLDKTGKLGKLHLRIIGMRLLKKIQNNNEIVKSELDSFIQKNLCIEFNNQSQKSYTSYENLKSSFNHNVVSNNKYSSIHKAKGLEANAVLVTARNESELEKWLRIKEDKTDYYNLGFVAFSRAQDILCLACLQKPSLGILERIKALNFHNSNPSNFKSETQLSLF